MCVWPVYTHRPLHMHRHNQTGSTGRTAVLQEITGVAAFQQQRGLQSGRTATVCSWTISWYVTEGSRNCKVNRLPQCASQCGMSLCKARTGRVSRPAGRRSCRDHACLAQQRSHLVAHQEQTQLDVPDRLSLRCSIGDFTESDLCPLTSTAMSLNERRWSTYPAGSSVHRPRPAAPPAPHRWQQQNTATASSTDAGASPPLPLLLLPPRRLTNASSLAA